MGLLDHLVQLGRQLGQPAPPPPPPAARPVRAPVGEFQPAPLPLGTPPAVGGTCGVQTPTPGAHRKWIVDRYSVQLTPPKPDLPDAQALVWYDHPGTGQLYDGTNSGSRDVSAGNALELRAGRRLFFQWTGVPDGSVGSVTLFYRDVPE